jgi:uncharacterized GH25 family protein
MRIVAALILAASLLTGQTNYSLIKGTVFTAHGRPVQGAKVVIVRNDVDAKLQKKSRKEILSDRNGEFAFRMDVGPAKFRLTAEVKGLQTAEKEIEVSGDERVDVSVVLKN